MTLRIKSDCEPPRPAAEPVAATVAADPAPRPETDPQPKPPPPPGPDYDVAALLARGFTVHDGRVYNAKGYNVCGVLNQHHLPCQRIGRCPFHPDSAVNRPFDPSTPRPAPPPREPYKRGWSREEHFLFLRGLDKHGRGAWKQIAAMVGTRTPTQIQSHAQKYFLRQKAVSKNKRSIHDLTLASPEMAQVRHAKPGAPLPSPPATDATPTPTTVPTPNPAASSPAPAPTPPAPPPPATTKPTPQSYTLPGHPPAASVGMPEPHRLPHPQTYLLYAPHPQPGFVPQHTQGFVPVDMRAAQGYAPEPHHPAGNFVLVPSHYGYPQQAQHQVMFPGHFAHHPQYMAGSQFAYDSMANRGNELQRSRNGRSPHG